MANPKMPTIGPKTPPIGPPFSTMRPTMIPIGPSMLPTIPQNKKVSGSPPKANYFDIVLPNKATMSFPFTDMFIQKLIQYVEQYVKPDYVICREEVQGKLKVLYSTVQQLCTGKRSIPFQPISDFYLQNNRVYSQFHRNTFFVLSVADYRANMQITKQKYFNYTEKFQICVQLPNSQKIFLKVISGTTIKKLILNTLAKAKKIYPNLVGKKYFKLQTITGYFPKSTEQLDLHNRIFRTVLEQQIIYPHKSCFFLLYKYPKSNFFTQLNLIAKDLDLESPAANSQTRFLFKSHVRSSC